MLLIKEDNKDISSREIFSGKWSKEVALEKIRERLLDLSGRNRLVNYKHPKGKSRKALQFVNVNSLNELYSKLLEEKKALFVPVPEPQPEPESDFQEVEDKQTPIEKPDAKDYAKKIGIPISYDLPIAKTALNEDSKRKDLSLQTLLYPEDLEKTVKNIGAEASLMIDERGSNMLYLVFGFLEYFESKASLEPMLGPLLALPVKVERGEINTKTQIYNYYISYTGEDIVENITLRQKLLQEFRLHLPELDEDATPEKYFQTIQKAFENQPRWKVRRQLTLCLLSFGKLSMWRDLDPKNPVFLEHPLINGLFDSSSSNRSETNLEEEYDIDNHSVEFPLIYDTDASQHTALIDAMSGKSMVINGPPGTGKSQTITNIIAAAIHDDKKVLFVSEKLAALQVVKSRLDKANLGHFCLELHSHKAQKKAFLKDLEYRIDARFHAKGNLNEKIKLLSSKKRELNRYVEIMKLMGTNALDLSVQEVIWASERRRQMLDGHDKLLHKISFQNASQWSLLELNKYRTLLDQLGSAFNEQGIGEKHPWRGFEPFLIPPDTDEKIVLIIEEIIPITLSLVAVASILVSMGADKQSELHYLEKFSLQVIELHTPPLSFHPKLLSRMFSSNDPNGVESHKALINVFEIINKVRSNLQAEENTLTSHPSEKNLEELEMIIAELKKHFSTFKIHIDDLNLHKFSNNSDEFVVKLESLSAIISSLQPNYSFISKEWHNNLIRECQNFPYSKAFDLPLTTLIQHEESLRDVLRKLRESFDKTEALALELHFPFDETENSIEKLESGEAFEDLLIDSDSISHLIDTAVAFSNSQFKDQAISDIAEQASTLQKVLHELESIHSFIKKTTTETGQEFTGKLSQVDELVVLGRVSSNAPIELMPYRVASYSDFRILDTIKKANLEFDWISSEEKSLSKEFDLELVTQPEVLLASAIHLDTNDSIFNLFNSEWRKAKKTFIAILKLKEDKTKRKSRDMSQSLKRISEWKTRKAFFVENKKYHETFGELFDGTFTDFQKIELLSNWIKESQNIFAVTGTLLNKVNLITFDIGRIQQFGGRYTELERIHKRISELKSLAEKGFSNDQILLLANTASWEDIEKVCRNRLSQLNEVVNFFTPIAQLHLTPAKICILLKTKLAIETCRPDLSTLLQGESLVREAGGNTFENLTSNWPSHWKERFLCIQSLIERTSLLRKHVEPHSNSATLTEIIKYCSAKIECDNALKNLIGAEVNIQFLSWNEYMKFLHDISRNVLLLRKILSQFALSDKTVSDVIRAMRLAIKTDKYLETLSQDTKAQHFFDPYLAGVNTDIEALKCTWDWGNRISTSAISTATIKALLNENAKDDFAKLSSAAHSYLSLLNEIKDKLKLLEEYGKIDWDKWLDHHTLKPTPNPKGLLDRFEAAREAKNALFPLSRYLNIRTQCIEEGFTQHVELLEGNVLPPSKVGISFERVFYGSIAKDIYLKNPILQNFSGENHSTLRSEYQALDKEIISTTGANLAQSIARKCRPPVGKSGLRASDFTEFKLLKREISKKKGHIPIRQLMQRAGTAIQELKPCFMMGPLAVAQYLEKGVVEFDIIIMDEASQLTPEDALGAIARGKQLIVIGDSKQLPPTNFFKNVDTDDDEDDVNNIAAFQGTESILDICQQLYPCRTLRWHYRSQHQSLIAFSNHHFYDKRLVVFPSPYESGAAFGVSWNYVENGVYQDRTNLPEAQRVVDAIVLHMINNSNQSLGVVTLNRTQKELIQDLLDQKLKAFEEGENFKKSWEFKGSPFFIKNLENVQGDERDVIFISTTFGKAAGASNVHRNFGPISREDGWRRLNVLITRAKIQLSLFSSMDPEDIVVEANTPKGTSYLRGYLDFVKRGVLVDTDYSEREPDSDFEISVANVLKNWGYEVVPQLGVANYYIDIAVRNPDRRGEFLTAIECDGATYHSSASARDRDRIRQEVLESKGWRGRIWRIWSTDWFKTPKQECDRLLSFLEDLRKKNNKPLNSSEINKINEFEDHISLSTHFKKPLKASVNDHIEYINLENPEEIIKIKIDANRDNFSNGIINIEHPLALAIIGSTIGTIFTIPISRFDSNPKKFKILNIKRD